MAPHEPPNPGGPGPLDWRALVAEALRRRRAGTLTQREHAALANVSVATLAAFERGERSLTLAKALDILRAVGLVAEAPQGDPREAFLRDSLARWQALTAGLPAGAPARFPRGASRIDYALEGDLRPVGVLRFRDLLRKAVLPNTGWPMFRISRRAGLAPREVDGVWECWFPPSVVDADRAFEGPADCDFWRAAPEGRLFLLRGYEEDGQETFPAGAVLDAALPIWRLAEALSHAARLAEILRRTPGSPITVRFRAVYTGLAGRVLRSWTNPSGKLGAAGVPARSDTVQLEAAIPAAAIEQDLAGHLTPLVAALFVRFGITGPIRSHAESEVRRFRQSRMP